MGLYRGILGLYWGCIGTMENKMETTIHGLGFNPIIGYRFLGAIVG